METDSLFYRLFSEKPKLVFELLGEKAPRTSYTFGSYEIKQTSLRADGILQPRSSKSPIVFVEAQGYLDRKNEVYPSFFAKIFMYLRDQTPVNDWRAVMLFTERKFDPGVPIHYQDFLITGRLQLVYLDEMTPAIEDPSLEVSLIQLFSMKEKLVFDGLTTDHRSSGQGHLGTEPTANLGCYGAATGSRMDRNGLRPQISQTQSRGD